MSRRLAEHYSIKTEKQLALERYEAQEDTSHDSEDPMRDGSASLAFGLVDDTDELRELDRRRKARSRGREPGLPETEKWWEADARLRKAILSDPALLRSILATMIEAEDVTLEDALSTMKRGRIPAVDRPAHDLLVRCVARLHEGGAALTTLAEAIGKDRRSVEQLVAQGQAPCRRHEAFQADCPSCRGI
jgi:hypothetical protein